MRNGNARVKADRIKVKRLAQDGTRTYRAIADRTGLPLGTVCRYAAELRRNGDIPARRPDRTLETEQ
jgi:uncharacterized protein YerC